METAFRNSLPFRCYAWERDCAFTVFVPFWSTFWIRFDNKFDDGVSILVFMCKLYMVLRILRKIWVFLQLFNESQVGLSIGCAEYSLKSSHFKILTVYDMINVNSFHCIQSRIRVCVWNNCANILFRNLILNREMRFTCTNFSYY